MILSYHDRRKCMSVPTRTLKILLSKQNSSTHNRSTQTCLSTLSIAKPLEAISDHDFILVSQRKYDQPTIDIRRGSASFRVLQFFIMDFVLHPNNVSDHTQHWAALPAANQLDAACFFNFLGSGARHCRDSPFHDAHLPNFSLSLMEK
jgi:hypothetical protein